MGSKIGIIFAFLLSIAAAGGAYYLHQTLTEERGFRVSLEKKYDDVKEKVLNLQSEKEQIKAAKEQYQAESEEYQRKIQSVETRFNQIKTQAAKISSERINLEEQLKEKEARLAEMESKIVELKKQAEEAMLACKVTPADVKTSLASAGEGLVFGAPETASSSVPAVTEDVAPPPAVEPFVTPSAPVAVQAPMATGPRVLTVNRKFNFVVVNMGMKDGLKMGDTLKVFKGGAENATLQIEKLYDKFSAATIVREDPTSQVREGDEVRKS